MVHRQRRSSVLLALLLSSVLASACTMRQGDFTVMTNRMVNLDRVDLDELPRQKRVKGEETKLIELFFIPFPPSSYPSIEGAVDDALNKGDGDLITDAVITMTRTSFILGTTQKITVEGDVVATRRKE